MKTCISTHSFSRLISSGVMDHFAVLDNIHEMGVPAAELVLDDHTSGSSAPLDFACRLADHARRLGLEVPIYTWEGRAIWGITGRVMKHLAEVLRGRA